MGRLHGGLLRRAASVLCLAAWLMAGCPGPASADNTSESGSKAATEVTRPAVENQPQPVEAEHPMEAVDVLGPFGFGSISTTQPSTLLNIGTDAVVSSGSAWLPQTNEEYIRRQLLDSRQRIQALSLATVADDSLGSGERFNVFPDAVLMEAPSLREAQTLPQPAADKPHSKAASPKQPSRQKASPAGSASATRPVASAAGETSITDVLDELTAAEQTAADERIIAALLAENDNKEESADAEAASGVIDNAEPQERIDPAYGGFHGLIDLSGASDEELDEEPAAQPVAPGAFMTRFGIRMAIFTVVLLFLASFLKGKGNPLARLQKKSLKVLETVSLGPGRQIVIVDMQGSHLVLGVTNGSINLLDRLPGDSSGEAYRENVQDVIQREAARDDATWQKRPALNLLDNSVAKPTRSADAGGYSKRISVSELRRARGNPLATGSAPHAHADNDLHSRLISRVRGQLERIQG